LTRLEQWSAPILARLPHSTDGDDDEFRFEAEQLPEVPSELTTEALILRPSAHIYRPSFRVDRVECFAGKDGYASLGALLATLLVRPPSERVVLELSDPRSEVRRLAIEAPYSREETLGLQQLTNGFTYDPMPVQKHPWDFPFPEHHYPWLALTNDADYCRTEEDWARRDLLRGFGSAIGVAKLAQLLLDLSREGNEITEVELECEGGFRGVAALSAEIRFWLPGNDFCVPSDFP